MLQPIISYLGGVIFIIILAWRFIPAISLKLTNEKILSKAIGVSFYVGLSLWGYTYSLENWDGKITKRLFWVAIYIFFLLSTALMGFLAESYLQPAIDTVMNKIKESKFGYQWKEYDAKGAAPNDALGCYGWYSLIGNYDQWSLFKMELFSKFDRDLTPRYLTSQLIMVFVAALAIYLFYHQFPDSPLFTKNFNLELKGFSLSYSLMLGMTIFSLLGVYFILFLISMGLILLKLLSAFNYWFIKPTKAFYFARAIKFERDGKYTLAIRNYRKLLFCLIFKDDFHYPVMGESEYQWKAFSRQEINRRIFKLESKT